MHLIQVRPRYSGATGVPRRVAELRTHPSNLIRLVPAKGGSVETPNWGIEPVPERLRVLGVFDSMLLWTNLSISLLVLVAASYFDLSLKNAVVATVVGGLI